MATKHIYFVRHGETLANRAHRHQGPDEPLSDCGREQSHAVADMLRQKGVDTLYCSPYARTRETAEIIGEELGVPLSTIESVKEFRRPDSLYGRRHYSLKSLLYIMQLYIHRTDAEWDNEGAESMFDVRNRILDAKRDIAAIEGKHIAIVSHSIFMDMFTQAVCADRPLKLREFIGALFLARKMPNTGIIEFELDMLSPSGACNWWPVK